MKLKGVCFDVTEVIDVDLQVLVKTAHWSNEGNIPKTADSGTSENAYMQTTSTVDCCKSYRTL